MRPSGRRNFYLLASTSILTLGLVAAPVVVDFDFDRPILKVAQADSSCFTGDTRVLMADGDEKPIRAVCVGDLVMGPGGRANRVIDIERPVLGDRLLYAINGGPYFVTAEHPFMTASGWKAVDPEATAAESPGLPVGRLALGDCLTTLRAAGAPSVAGNLALAGLALEAVVLRDLDARAADPQTPLFNLLLDGDHAYFADGHLVHNKEGGEGGSGEGSGEGGSGEGSGEGSGSGESSGSGSGEGAEAGEAGEPGEGADDGDSSGPGGGDAEDDGAEAGESGSSGKSGRSGKSGKSGSSGTSGKSGPSSASPAAFGGLDQVGPDLSPDQEADAISKGWQ